MKTYIKPQASVVNIESGSVMVVISFGGTSDSSLEQAPRFRMLGGFEEDEEDAF